MLIKYIKSVLWRVVKRLSYIQDARCLNVNATAKIGCSCWKLKKELNTVCREKTGCRHGEVYSPTNINHCDLRQGFSNLFAGLKLNENWYFQGTVFFYLNKRKWNVKTWLTARMNYIMLLAVLHVGKYLWLVFSIF